MRRARRESRRQDATHHATVRREAFGQDQALRELLCHCLIPHGQPPARVRHPVLLGAHRHGVEQRRHLGHNLPDRHALHARLAQMDEVRVLREATAVENDGHMRRLAERGRRTHVCEGHGLPAAGVVGRGDHHACDRSRRQQLTELRQVDVAAEAEVAVRGAGRQVDAPGTGRLCIRAGRVKEGVRQERLVLAAQMAEEKALRRTALVRGEEVRKVE